MNLMVTGHRPQGLKKVMAYGRKYDNKYVFYCNILNRKIEDFILKGYDYFISGGAIGVDLDFAKKVLDFKSKYAKENKNLTLEIVSPCKNQAAFWKNEDKENFAKIVSQADKITILYERYTPWCMQKRNEYMVDHSDLVLVFWNGDEHGGTWNTINYAKKRNKKMDIVDLRNL